MTIGEDGKQQLSIQMTEGVRSINLIPFSTIYSYLAFSNDQVSNWQQVSLVNLLGNVLVFVPFGIFLPLLWSIFRKFTSLLWMSICIPLFIEITQLFIGRSTDIDDVILNMLGIIFGFFLYKIHHNLFHKGKAFVDIKD
ncbi:VanZ family protein [Niallia sp. RD1]|nr:VanZ family protein [Niallia sp. RD1]UTI40313.1 VanZ family protein [Niallia sp. RD1]